MDSNGFQVSGTAKRLRTDTGYILLPVDQPSLPGQVVSTSTQHGNMWKTSWTDINSIPFDTTSSAILNIGSTNATGISLAKTGVDTSINGDLEVKEELYFDSAMAECYVDNNVLLTTIPTVNTFVKANISTTLSPMNNKFTHTPNRLTYISTTSRHFHIGCTFSIVSTSNNNREWDLMIAKNGIVIPGSRVHVSTTSMNSPTGSAIHIFSHMNYNDYIELWINNNTDDADVTIKSINMFAMAMTNKMV